MGPEQQIRATARAGPHGSNLVANRHDAFVVFTFGKEAQTNFKDQVAQGELGDIVFIELPEAGESFDKMATFGTITEYSIPLLLLLTAGNPLLTALVLCLMASFHGFIAVNNPSGMPIEWNILMVYGGVFLFGFHPEASMLALGQLPLLLAFLFIFLFAIPCYGNFVPARVSFLLAMRYYAGNWAYNIWLFRKGSSAKLHQLTKAAGTMREQLEAALALAPDLARAHFFLGSALRTLGRYDEALTHFNVARAQYPRDRVVLGEIGRVHFLERRFEEAIETFTEVLRIDPENLLAHYNLMLAYRGNGETERAAREQILYERFKADEPSQAITGPYLLNSPEDNNERQPVHEH